MTLDTVWQRIEVETERLSSLNRRILGCRFLYSPQRTFSENNGLLLAGMNPGFELDMSNRAYPADGRNAYLHEDWGRSHFRQRMLDFMTNVFNGFKPYDAEKAFNETLTANFLPFRTKNYKALGLQQREARQFATLLWADLIPHAKIKAILCCGKPSANGFRQLCKSHGFSIPVMAMPHASSSIWGNWRQVHGGEVSTFLTRAGFPF